MDLRLDMTGIGLKGRSIDPYWFLGFFSIACIALALMLLKFAPLMGVAIDPMRAYLVFFSALPLLAGLTVFGGMSFATGASSGGRANRWLQGIAPYLPLAVLLYGLWGIDRTLHHATYETVIDPSGFDSSPKRFFWGCAAATLLLGYWAAYRSSLRLRMPALFPDTPQPHVMYVFLAVFILSLFKPDLGHDSLSYDPYTGPASAVVLGSLPLVDAFSQYGLNYLLLAAGLKVLPWSMYSTSLIITLLDLVYYGVVAIICVRMCRNQWTATLLSAFMILFLASAALYNPSYTPSAGAMRYLPSMLVLCAVACSGSARVFNSFTVLALMVSSLWSLEALIFSSIVFLVFIFAASLGSQPFKIGRLLRHGLLLFGTILAPHVLLAAGYQLAFSMWPRYDIYLELVTTQTTNSVWTSPADPAIRTWVIFGFVYALAFSWGLFRAWTEANVDERHRHGVMACVAALGIVQLSYYAGRAVTPVLVFLAFPLMILFVVFVDSLVHAFNERKAAVGCHQRIFVASAVLLIIACGGVIGDRFFREPFVLRSNATLLRECLTWHEGRKHCWTGLTRRIRDKLQQPAGFVLPKEAGVTDKNQAAWQLIPTGMTLENMSAYLLAKKWLDGQDRIFLFISDSANVLFALKKRNALGLTHPMVDDRSSILRDKAFAAAKSVSEGTIIMVGDMSQQPIEREVVEYLRKHWVLERIDGGHSVVVYRLKAIGAKNV